MTHKHICVLSLAVFAPSWAFAQITLNPVAERAIGTPTLIAATSNPNLVEGRELYLPEAVALDTSVPAGTPPILYVADYGNNRVLAWKNGAGFTSGEPADLVIGQPDKNTTFPQGPSQSSSNLSGGLSRPSGLAVDSSGNLYVVDGGNNRILRFAKPFAQTGQYPFPNLVIGQTNFAGHGANYPTNTASPTAQGLFFASGSTVLTASLTFDSTGNLWVTDPGNGRILRFKASDLAGTASGGLTADLVLGQPDFVTLQAGLNSGTAANFFNLKQFFAPSGLGFDPTGNLFVGDFNRALVFVPPFTSGMSASPSIMGIFPTGYTFPTTAAAVQALVDQTAVYQPTAFFFLAKGAGVGVVDTSYNRIMIFPAFASWPAANAPPQALSILGQPNTCTQYANQTCKAANNGSLLGATGSTFSSPAGVVYTGTDVYLADAGNNRMLDLPQTGATLGAASRVLGQDYYTTNAPNLIEGREFNFSGTISGNTFEDAAMAVDYSTSTPHLYVADPYNNRILGFKDARTFQNGAKNKADIVIGQASFSTNLINYPTGDPNQPSQSSLYRPIGLLVDSQGNLYVADSFNSRVLRFPAPFSYTGAAPEPADLVLGQLNFTSKIPDPTSTTMAAPYGLAFTPSCNTLSQPCPAPNGLVVSDQIDNRVLYIPTTNGTFAAGADNGKAATVVFGQASFNTIATGSTLSGMNNPHHVSCDTNGYVYVADTSNNRILIYPDPHSLSTPATGEAASTSITGLSGPEGVFVSPVTGEIWVANTGSANSVRYTNYQSVLLGLGSYSTLPEVSGNFVFHPLAVIEDQYGDLFVADDSFRVAFYYPGLNMTNAASFLSISSKALAPNAIGTIFPCTNCAGTQFVAPLTQLSSYPVPTILANLEVLVDGTPAPLYFVSPGQINFIVPNAARTSGFADVQVVQVSTGQILGAAQVPMAAVAPGAFEYPGGQTGAKIYGAAINQDGTVNSATNPAVRGQFISLYMTGQGSIPGLPPDGTPPTTAISGQYPPTVLLNYVDVNSATYGESGVQHILYSGVNGYPGMWQINVKIPATVVVTAPVSFVVEVNGISNWDANSGFQTYIYIK